MFSSSAETYSSYWNESLWSNTIVLGSSLVSDVAAASFIPHSAPTPKLREMLKYSSDFYGDLCRRSPEAGVVLKKGREFVDPPRAKVLPWYSDCVFDVSPCVPASDALASSTSDPLTVLPSDKQAGWRFTTFLIEPRFLIPWLRLQLEHFGVTFEKRKVTSLSDLSSFDIVVNCTGLGARTLANDVSVRPVSGQVLLLRFSGLNEWVRDTSTPGSIGYVYPQRNTVVVGGTKVGEVRNDVDILSEELKTKCSQLMPSVAASPSVGINGGYRPLRSTFRLEIDESSLHQSPKVVHNYGHGGEGFCFSPGCAREVVRLVDSLLGRQCGVDYEVQALKRVSKIPRSKL